MAPPPRNRVFPLETEFFPQKLGFLTPPLPTDHWPLHMEAIMQESPFYHEVLQQGEARGINIGEARGEARGINIGIDQGSRQMGIETTVQHPRRSIPNRRHQRPQTPT